MALLVAVAVGDDPRAVGSGHPAPMRPVGSPRGGRLAAAAAAAAAAGRSVGGGSQRLVVAAAGATAAAVSESRNEFAARPRHQFSCSGRRWPSSWTLVAGRNLPARWPCAAGG